MGKMTPTTSTTYIYYKIFATRTKKNNTNNFGQNNDNKKEGCGLKKITTNGEFLPKQTNSTIVFVNKQLISLDNILYREEEKFKRGSFFINICAAVFTIFVPCHH